MLLEGVEESIYACNSGDGEKDKTKSKTRDSRTRIVACYGERVGCVVQLLPYFPTGDHHGLYNIPDWDLLGDRALLHLVLYLRYNHVYWASPTSPLMRVEWEN